MLTEYADGLREAIRVVKPHHPFEIVAMVLPPGDMAYPKRWALIEASGEYGEWGGKCWACQPNLRCSMMDG